MSVNPEVYLFELRGRIGHRLHFNRHSQISEADFSQLLAQLEYTPCPHFLPDYYQFPIRPFDSNFSSISVTVRTINHQTTDTPPRIHTACIDCETSSHTTIIEICRYSSEILDISTANDDFDNACVVTPVPRLILN